MTFPSIDENGSIELIFWPGVLGALDYDAQLEIAQKASFSGLAISPLLIQKLFDAGLSPNRIKELAAERGVKLTHLDGMSSWAPVWLPDPTAPTYMRYRDRFDFSAERCLEMCDALGLASLVAVPMYEYGALSDDAVAEALARFSDQAERHGVFVELEFMPHAGIRTLGQAWKILNAAGTTNAGLMVDTWHLCKSPSELKSDLDLLASLPAGICRGMQLVDAHTDDRAEPFAELLAHGRGFPGEGVLPIPEIITAVLSNSPGLSSVGPEPSSQKYLHMPVPELARLADQSTREAMAKAMV